MTTDPDVGAAARRDFSEAIDALERIAPYIDGDDYERLAIGMLAAGQAIDIAYPTEQRVIADAVVTRLSRLDPEGWTPHANMVKALRRRGHDHDHAEIVRTLAALAERGVIESARLRLGSRRSGTFYRLARS